MDCLGTFAKFATSAASKRPADVKMDAGRHFSGLWANLRDDSVLVHEKMRQMEKHIFES